MRNKMLWLLALVLCFAAMTGIAYAAFQWSLKTDDTGYRLYAYDNGKTLKGEQTADGITYTFTDGGYVKGKNDIVLVMGNVRYYIDENDCVLKEGWKTVGGSKYYFKPYAVTGTETLTGEDGVSGIYYFDSEGKMQTGLITTEDGKKFRFDTDGRRINGWYTASDGSKYYYDFYDGAKAGSRILDGNTYLFDSDGKTLTGWQTVNGSRFYFDQEGKMLTGLRMIDGETYYLHDSVQTGMITIQDGSGPINYYFDTEGRMQKEKLISVDGRTCYFGADGKQVTGILTIDGTTYDFEPYAVTGLRTVWNEERKEYDQYYYDEEGKMQTGLINLDGKIYLFQADGRAASGWQTAGGATYYFLSYNHTASTGLQRIDSSYYFFDEAGVMQTGWQYANNNYGWRLFSDSGAMVTDWSDRSSVTVPSCVDVLNPRTFAGADRSFVICCEPGSGAERMARRYGFQYDNGKERIVGCDISGVSAKVDWVVSHYTDDSMTNMEKARILHDWLVYNAHYDTSYSAYGPDGVLLRGSGVCQSYADAYKLLLDKAGIENCSVSGTADNGSGNGPQGHAWNMVKLGNEWYHVDTTWDDPTNLYHDAACVSGNERYKYFLVSDSTIGENHFWSGNVTAGTDLAYQGEPGWQQIDGRWVYYDAAGILVTGPAWVDGLLYAFGEDGRLLPAGWNKANGTWYYVNADNVALSDTWKQDGGWYYLMHDGRMATGWQVIGGETYYFSDDGAMQTGWIEEGGKWYLLRSSGAMATGWVRDGGIWYYLEENGSMATGWEEIEGSWYLLDSSGAMQTGWVKQGKTWYYLDGDGAMQTGWYQDRDQKWYWFDKDGAMSTGWTEINGQWEMFSESGVWQYTWDGN